MEWNVIVYDKPGADRTPVRAQHLAAIPATSAAPVYHDIEKTKFAGSTFHLIANSKEEIIEFLKKDIYYEKGIWDIDSVVAHPMGVAVRKQKDMPGVKF